MTKRLTSSTFSVEKLSEKIRSGEISPVDLVEICLNRIKKFNPMLNAFITILEQEEIYREAQIAEKQIKQGKYSGHLHGIPFSIKDIFCAKKVRCTAGSKILSDYIPDFDATVVKKMKAAGGILIGTNNLNEFASGITGINPFYGSSKNPWNISRISGGSSGGSAVAVAAGMTPISLGSDTGGSIRVPASLCGVVGLKPNYGRTSRYGVIPLAPSLDHVGCLTRSAWDAAAVLECISGSDPLDQTSVQRKVPFYTDIVEKESVDKRICVKVPNRYFFDSLNLEVENLFYNFMQTKLINATIIDVDLPNTEKYYKSWRDIRLSEAAEIHLTSLRTRSNDYSSEVRNMLIEGTKISAVEYLHAISITKKIRGDFLSILNKDSDVIVVPTTTIPAPEFDEKTVSIGDSLFEIREALLRNTMIFNSTGLPSLSIPIGLTKDKMPIGVQIIGAPFKEDVILSIAYNYERMNSIANTFVPPLSD
ncbi:MAG: Asp-tRNA(Asn)/Glu-tRNA(Gln) amidotransferase subunit GatA [Nitrososphaeraceae archaeon]|nr:Asp-tRNA(Asn)/Glu-tRNA(Gln) amidotransferase subunit GatA [Nitrososphaeraceae archaeon]